jgi:hypothetical protein
MSGQTCGVNRIKEAIKIEARELWDGGGKGIFWLIFFATVIYGPLYLAGRLVIALFEWLQSL